MCVVVVEMLQRQKRRRRKREGFRISLVTLLCTEAGRRTTKGVFCMFVS